MFYDKYAEICKKRGISMSAAATEAGLSKSLVTKWKTNNVEVPSPDVLKKLSTYFGIPVSELLGEDKTAEGKKEKPATPKDAGLSKEMQELIDCIKMLPDDKVQMLLQVAKSIR